MYNDDENINENNIDEVTDESSENADENVTKDDSKQDEYEKVCYVCRRPESKAGHMVNMPGNIYMSGLLAEEF